MLPLNYALVNARLSGRHGEDRHAALQSLAEDSLFDEDEMRQLDAAFTEGVEARLSGYSCHCTACQNLTPAMREKEERRSAYFLRRYQQLVATGKTYEEAARIIEGEIATGAAQQEAPLVVRKSGIRP